MKKIKEIVRVMGDFRHLLPILKLQPPADDASISIASQLEDTVERHGSKSMVIFEGRELTWSEFNGQCNQLAHYFSAQGIKHGDNVALIMENRIEYLLCLFALAKLGAVVGLINNSLVGKQLQHCITTIEASKCVVGEEVQAALGDIVNELPLKSGVDYLWLADSGASKAPSWALDAGADLAQYPQDNLAQTAEVKAGETVAYVFTSGTTGLPKAAILQHRKFLFTSGIAGHGGFRIKPTDRMHICLPLYHVTGLVIGFGSCLQTGASFFLRRRFSAGSFWEEIQQHQINCLIYIGEMCRYIAAQDTSAAERNNPLQTMMGNGLRPDVWDTFKDRFDVKRICELYGASEGNVAFINLLNKEKTIGMTSAEVLLVKYDVDEDEVVRDSDGHCIPVEIGEPGLLLGKVSELFRFDGYKNKEASEQKLFRGVLEPNDCYFNTGDLIRQIDVGFSLGKAHYQFVDRTGDTFRWRAENVSTNEVGEILNGFDQIEMSNVYGVEVPGAEGRAGMVALHLKPGEELDIARFSAHVQEHLPSYARPVFLRIQTDMATTQTFKMVKGDLRKSAYHPDQVQDPLYVLKPRKATYEPLDETFYGKLQAGEGGY